MAEKIKKEDIFEEDLFKDFTKSANKAAKKLNKLIKMLYELRELEDFLNSTPNIDDINKIIHHINGKKVEPIVGSKEVLFYTGCGATLHEMGKALERQVEEMFKKPSESDAKPKELDSSEFQKELNELVSRFGGENLTVVPEYIYTVDRDKIETKYEIRFSTVESKNRSYV